MMLNTYHFSSFGSFTELVDLLYFLHNLSSVDNQGLFHIHKFLLQILALGTDVEPKIMLVFCRVTIDLFISQPADA
jgi:hypothetical protein